MKSSKIIRKSYLQFFGQKLHHEVKSAPIVIKNDPTLMFTNAGMNQFKDIFLGLKNPTHKRVTDTQKCLRVSGKHNDLEEVGHDTYHHTMFEMLGNWSFGDYYKPETIAWAWELLTKVFEIDPDRIYVTIFAGDKEDNLGQDNEARDEWKKWIAHDRILPFGKEDNFWEMGEIGPSGPCSEIHVDMRSDEERAKIDGKTLVNADHPQVVEVWNLVFIQYNRLSDRSLEDLPEKHIDTGMGFERMVMVLQNKQSTYDTDLFDNTRGFLENLTGIKYLDATDTQQVAFRVIVDHIRAIVFAIGDGQIPSNTGAGYVIRRVLRRAIRYAYSQLGLNQPFMNEMVAILAQDYAGVFDEVKEQQNFIERIILEEEKGFLKKLELGEQMFADYLKANPENDSIDGDFAFKLYDTFGFPIDLTELMAREKGKKVDMTGFKKNLKAQKDRSRKATEMTTGDWVTVKSSEDLPRFLGYDTLEVETSILQYRTVKTAKKELYQIVLEETPFYAESGGQIGDRGTISNGTETIKVVDTKKENELIVHFVNKLPASPEGSWTASVYSSFRQKVMANHTATHLLHAALRNHLGTHVEQRGSLVSDKALRFDFSHFARVEEDEIAKIEAEVNQKIAEGIALTEYREMPIDEAKAMGAMALFGEKYGDMVRAIVFDQDYSVELCGGTHVSNTRDIRFFKLISEGSSAAGIRRIEAYTSDRAIDFLADKAASLDRISTLLKSPRDLEKAVEDLNNKNKELEKELHTFRIAQIRGLKDSLINNSEQIGEINVIRKVVEVSNSDDLKSLSFDLKKVTENTLIVLGAVINNKPLLSVIMSDDLAQTNRFHAGKMVKELAREIQGGGGGQPFYATAGGRNTDGLAAALAKVETLL